MRYVDRAGRGWENEGLSGRVSLVCVEIFHGDCSGPSTRFRLLAQTGPGYLQEHLDSKRRHHHIVRWYRYRVPACWMYIVFLVG